MSSSMITGEQRWSSKRRGGMTVLGKVAKVAVPKPLNLPSQRLENHGLDPNVEIVPKGTLSWGSKPSSASSNAWATSALSPSTDGGSSSPSHLAGRPLSSSGTRPSTAGSEKVHDSNVNSWGPNSRPSSASGVLGSNHTSLTSLRPRSAETRPGSSHLSRFAEPSPEVSRPWGAAATSERTGDKEGFSLSSGDFPTLGSEKDESKRNSEPLDVSHGRPGSSSGGPKSMSDSIEIANDGARDTDMRGHSWREDRLPFVEDGQRPNMDRWQEDPHVYPNPNIGPPHFDSWRGPPSVNPQGGVWYRGPPVPTPYGGPVPPGGFPMEPFPYYRPQVPAPALANSQPIPPPGPGSHGHHPKNGDMYRPHMPESFMRPVGPMRPGFYPPPVPFDGYYRPPMGFCNPNERDFAFMGMANGPPVYNRPINQNAPYQNSSHPRSEGRGHEKVDPGLLHAPRGDHAILAKPNGGWNQNEKEKWGHRVPTDGLDREKGILSNTTLKENAWGDDHKKSKIVDYVEISAKDDVSSRPRDNRFHSNNPPNSMLSKNVSNVEDPGTGPATDNLASSKDHTLIQKIEGLNAKARASGGSQDAIHEEELTERVQVVNVRAHQSMDKAETEVVLERHYPTGVLVPLSPDTSVVASEKSGDSVPTSGPRTAIHGAQNRGTRHGKGSFDGQKPSGWGRKPQSQSVQSAGSTLKTNDGVVYHNTTVQPSEVHKPNIEKGEGESAIPDIDCTDTQRAKMREIAKQRAIQLQKEEEERIREQKAKALAKLEELNRRSAVTQGVDAPSQKTIVPPGVLKSDDLRDDPVLEVTSIAGPSAVLSDKTAQINENGAAIVVDSTSTTLRHAGAEIKKNAQQNPSSSQIQSPTENVNFEDGAGNRTTPKVRDVPKHKLAGYKPLQNVPPEKNLSQNSILIGQIVVIKDHKMEFPNQEVAVGSKVDEGSGKELPEMAFASDLAASHKRRSNKSGKNKQKVESSNPVSPNDRDLGHAVSASAGDNASNVLANSSPVQLSADAKEPSKVLDAHSSVSREDVHGRMNNSWKAQHSRKARSSQGNKISEKSQSNDSVVWAPVHSHKKIDIVDQTSQKSSEPLVSSAVGESRPLSSSKTKRAEMERYVPKPVAKELAQGSTQQPPTLLVDHPPIAKASQESSSGTDGREKVPQGSEHVVKVGPAVESKNRHPKSHGSWRQRVSSESSAAQSLQSSSAGSTNKNIHPSGEQTARPNESTIIEPLRRPSELSVDASVSDGWNIVNDSSSKSPAALTGGKDHPSSRKGRSHPFKGQKASGNNLDHKDSNAGATDSHTTEVSHKEKIMSPRERRAASDRSAPHWQPKSQASSTYNEQGNRSHGGQNHMTEDIKGVKAVTGSDSGAHSGSHYNQSAKDPRPGTEDKAMYDMGRQESKRENRGPYVKGRPHSESQGVEAEFESASSEGADRRNDQRPSSGYRKNPNYVGRMNRVQDSRGDWSTMEPDNHQHYSSTNPERQRQTAQYEYQPVGPYNSNESESQFENQYRGPNFRERGRPRRGRGNFYGRQSGNE
ncbi:hypothetical protein vseg_013921 [Gypsophila vaccaria]